MVYRGYIIEAIRWGVRIAKYDRELRTTKVLWTYSNFAIPGTQELATIKIDLHLDDGMPF